MLLLSLAHPQTSSTEARFVAVSSELLERAPGIFLITVEAAKAKK
jgi:hypothetical protein